MIAKKYQELFDKLTPFIFSYKDNLEFFDLNALGQTIHSDYHFDPTYNSSLDFYAYLRQMDALTFADQGMCMDGWVYFDCATMPGAIVGFGVKAKELPKKLRQYFKKAKDDTFIPVSMFIAIPMLGNKWFGHNLSSLKSKLGDEYKGLGLLTKAFGIQVLKINEMYGATQWGSHAINIHSRLADMELITSSTIVHSHKNTLCYRSYYNREKILSALAKDEARSRKEDFSISNHDILAQESLQVKIENKEAFTLIGKPIYEDESVYYKVLRGFTSKAPK